MGLQVTIVRNQNLGKDFFYVQILKYIQEEKREINLQRESQILEKKRRLSQ